MKISDRTLATAHNAEVKEAQIARARVHCALLSAALETLERAVQDGGDLDELAEVTPLAAFEARARWEAVAQLAIAQLRESRTPAVSAPATAINPKHRKG